MGSGTLNYPCGEARSRNKAAERKGKALPALYRDKLANIGRLYYGRVQKEVGPARSGWGALATSSRG